MRGSLSWRSENVCSENIEDALITNPCIGVSDTNVRRSDNFIVSVPDESGKSVFLNIIGDSETVILSPEDIDILVFGMQFI